MQNQSNQIIQVGKIYKVWDRSLPLFIGKKAIREERYYWATVMELTAQNVWVRPNSQKYVPPTAWDQKNETEFSDGTVEIDTEFFPCFDHLPEQRNWRMVSPRTIIQECPVNHRVSIHDFNNTYSEQWRGGYCDIPRPETLEEFNNRVAERNRARFRHFLMNDDEQVEEDIE